MSAPDELYDDIVIYGRRFVTFSDLHTFIKIECPEKLAGFHRQYGKTSL